MQKNENPTEGGDVVSDQQHLFVENAQVKLLNDGRFFKDKFNVSNDDNPGENVEGDHDEDTAKI